MVWAMTAVEPDVFEAVAHELPRPLRREPVAPVTPQQPVAKIGYSRVIGLVGAVSGLEGRPADELVVDQSDPKAEPVHLLRGCDPPRVAGLDLLACARPAAEVAHHLRIRVELDLPLEVPVGEWHHCDPLGVQGLLGMGPNYVGILSSASVSGRGC